MKKVFSVVLATLLAVGCFAVSAFAADAPKMTVTLNDTDYPEVDILNDVDINKLVDGDNLKDTAKEWGTGTADVVAFRNAKCTDKEANATLCLVLDFGKEQQITDLTLSFYKCYNVMIGLGVENTLTVSASKDGETYNKIQDFDFTSEPAMNGANVNMITEVKDEVFTFAAPVNARYLELKLPYEPSSDTFMAGKVMWEFIGLTEIAATASDVPAAPDTPDTSDEPTTPDTSDAGIIATVVLAVAAIGGAALVIKKRA